MNKIIKINENDFNRLFKPQLNESNSGPNLEQLVQINERYFSMLENDQNLHKVIAEDKKHLYAYNIMESVRNIGRIIGAI